MSLKQRHLAILKDLNTVKRGRSILLCCLLSTFSAVGQTLKIEGQMELQDSHSDLIYNIIAFKADSSIYKGNVYMTTNFSLEVDCDSITGVQFSSLGCESLFYEKKELVERADRAVVQLGKIQLKPNLSLEEVTVTGTKKNMSISPTGYSVDIKNSYLSTYGTFDDVIKRIPGITVSPGKVIEVIGKYHPLFVLNGRRLTSTGDLERLNPKSIKTIYIDQNPGPEYDASYDAVVRVETMDYNQEFYSIDLRDQFQYGRKAGNNAEAILQRKDKNFVYGLAVEYDLSQYKQYDTEYKSVWRKTDSISTRRYATLTGKDKTLGLTPSVHWTINKQNKLEAIYRFNHTDTHFDSEQEYRAVAFGQKNLIHTYLKEPEKKNSHNPSLFYIYENDNHRLQASADYYLMNTKETQAVKESYEDASLNNHYQDFKDKYEIFGGAIDYKTAVGSWNINSGGKISGIKDDGRYKTNSEDLSTSLLKDNTYALYLGTSSSLSAFYFSAALRAEWNKVNYRNSFYAEPVKSDYFNLFPSASIKYVNPHFTTSLSYNKRIQRPSYKELNPNKSYIDPLSYIVGNPLLKSRITHSLALSFQYSNFVFIVDYSVQKNALAGILELTPDNKIAYVNANIPTLKKIDLVGIYSFNRKWFKSNLAVQAKLQELRFQDRVYTRFGSTPGITSRLNMDFDLWKNGSLNVIGYYYGNIWGTVTKMKNSGYVSFELSQEFSKGKWRIMAGVMDAFKTFHSNTWKSNLSNAIISMDTDDDSRYVYITLQYRIGKMKAPRNSNSIISDEKNRL